MSLSLDGTTGISCSGNITGGNIIGTLAPAVLVVTGNITGGNILTDGLISATSTVTAASVVGGVITGTSTSVSGTTTAASVVGGVITGTSTSVSGTTTAASVVGGVITGSSTSVTGNVTASYLLGNAALVSGLSATSISNGTSNVSVLSSGGNILIGVGSANIVLFTSAGIQNGQGNATGNIGNSTGYFNTVFAKATSAQYADLAEMYVADQKYPSGTVVEFGGSQEITTSSTGHSTKVAGIVSTNPSYLMNATQTGDNVVAVALIGRVPCQVVGTIAKGDRLVTSDIAGVAAPLNMTNYEPGCIIGKALADYNSTKVGTIEVAVGRD